MLAFQKQTQKKKQHIHFILIAVHLKGNIFGCVAEMKRLKKYKYCLVNNYTQTKVIVIVFLGFRLSKLEQLRKRSSS